MKTWPGGNGVRPSKPLAQTRPSAEPEPVDWPYPDDYDPEDDEPDGDDLAGPDGDEEPAAGPVRSELPAVLPTINRDELKWKARYHAHVAGRHALRIHLYVARTVRWMPRGVGKAVAKFWRWATDEEGRAMMGFARDEWDNVSWRSTKREHDRTVEGRRTVLIFALVCGLPVLLVVWATRPGWLYAAVLGALWLAGWYGAPADQPIVEHVQPQAPELRLWEPGVIRLAFEAAKLSFPPKEGQEPQWGKEIVFVSNVSRDGKTGTSVVLDLPAGITAAQAMGKKPALASGLSVAKVQLDITPHEESERRIELYIHDRDPYREEPPVTPLLDTPKLDFWEPIPFGRDARGNKVYFCLLWTHMLIGAIPRMGKSLAARLIGCAAALDPYVRLLVWNGKGDGTWTGFEKIAHRYGSGQRDGTVDGLIAALEEAWEDVQVRNETLERLRDQLTESKITKEMSRDRGLNMPLTVIFIDEVQVYLADKKPVPGTRQKRGDRILELLTDLAKVAPSVGYMLVLATQKPDSATSKQITGLRDNLGSAFCLKVKTRETAKMIVGEIPPGLSPVQFSTGHRGVGVLVGGQDETGEIDEHGRIVRTYFGDDETVNMILERAAVLRTKLGLLSGHAAGDDRTERAPDRLLDHILELAGPAEDKLPSRTVLDRLSAAHSDSYSGWTVETLRSHLRDAGVKTSHQIHRTNRRGERENLRGIDLDEVRQALARKLANVGSNGSNGANNDH